MPRRASASAFLLHQDFKRAPRIVGIGRGDKTDFAEFRHVPALGAIAAACRRRALGDVESFPVVAKLRQMHAAGVGGDRKKAERISLRADLLRHLFKFDPVVL